MSVKAVLVVGYGNTLRSDDAFGPMVVERLQSCFDDRRVRLLSRPLLSIDLVGDLERLDFLVLIDAATAGDRALVNVRRVEPEAAEAGTLAHEISPAALLGFAVQLYGRAPECELYSAVPDSTELGEQLTPRVAALAEAAVLSIRARITGYLDATARH